MTNKYTRIFLTVILFCFQLGASAQTIRTIAGNGYDSVCSQGDGGPAPNALIAQVFGVAVDYKGNVFIADNYYNTIRKVSPKGIISTYAGICFPGCHGDGGQATAAELSTPYSLTCDAFGNLYIADASNHAIRKIDTLGNLTTVAGIICSTSPLYYNGDGIPAVDARVGSPGGVAVDQYGKIYIADANSRVRMVDESGIIHTIAGNGTVGYGGNGGCATCTGIAMEGVIGVDVDDAGNVYIAEAVNNTIRKVNTAGIISLVAGQGPSYPGYSGDGGQSTAAKLYGPNAVRVDRRNGNIYIADQDNEVIRRITPDGIIRTVAGRYVAASFAGDGGSATSGQLANPSDICIDNYGNMFIADKGAGYNTIVGHRIREVFTKDTMHITCNHSDTICGAARVTFTVHEQQAHYWSFFKWQLNGVTVGSNTSDTYTTDTLHDGDRVTCQKIDTASGGILLAISDTAKMTVKPVVVPTLFLTSTGDTVCAGQQVSLTAHITHGGPFPVYQWYVFGTLTDTTTPTFTLTPGFGDIITCVMISDALCAIPDTAVAHATMYVNPSFHPLVTIVPKEGITPVPSDTVAYWGQIINLSSETTYGGTAPTFQWYQDEVPVPGATSIDFSQPYYTNHYLYNVMTSNAYCVVPTVDTSNIIHISVDHLTAGVKNINDNNRNFKITPNPNNGDFTLLGYLSEAGLNTCDITVTDLLGKVVYAAQAGIKNGNIYSSINLNNTISNGVYLLNIKYDGGSERLRFVINR